MRSGDTKIAPQKLHGLRKSRHWTQEELSEASGLSLRTIQRAEKTGSVSNSTLKSLAAVFVVNAAELEEGPPNTSRYSANRKWVFATTALVVLATLGVVLGYPSANWNPLNDRETVAILPFVSVSSDSQSSMLAHALTDELTLQLTQSQQATVVPARNSRIERLADSSISEVGGALSASLVVEGAIYHTGDERFRITVQVIDTKSSTHLWSESYNRNANEVVGIVPNIAQSIESLYRD
jgi:TolB-like protein/transcriptional regulator with XRE-family HTH domain